MTYSTMYALGKRPNVIDELVTGLKAPGMLLVGWLEKLCYTTKKEDVICMWYY